MVLGRGQPGQCEVGASDARARKEGDGRQVLLGVTAPAEEERCQQSPETDPGEYDGQPMQADLSAAFAYSGDQQIEVIQQFDDAPTVYRRFLKGHPTGGLQHLAVWVDSIAEKLAEVRALGFDYRVRQRYGDMHAYLDSADQPGVMIQLMARNPIMLELFEMIRSASATWDGKTDPVRRIDWSSGRPRVAD